MAEGHKDYSATPLWKKLGIREGARVYVIGAPDGFAQELVRIAEIPHAVEFLSRVQAMGREGGIGKPPPAPTRLDYAALISEERASKKAAKKARRAR